MPSRCRKRVSFSPRKISRLIICIVAISHSTASANDQLAKLDSAAENTAEAAKVVAELQQDKSLELLPVLNAMQGKSAVAKNWYLSLAQTIAGRDPEKARQELNQFLPRLSEDPDARYWAFRFLTSDDQELKESMLESMQADPCLELRYESVELAMKRLEANKDLSDSKLISAYQELLAAARLPEQIQQVAGKLDELGREVDLLDYFGFISNWSTVGPFPNPGQSSFDVVYPPEDDYATGKLASSSGVSKSLSENAYTGVDGDSVTWKTVTTDSADGAIDLNEAYDKGKGVIVYAVSSFNAPSDINCEVRIGSPNAVKVWVNGELQINREVYHSGNQIDQYTAGVKLRKGQNAILVKSCQNEQTEPWAQDWNFQLRFTDATGLAIRPAQ